MRVGIDSTAQVQGEQFTINLTAGASDNLPPADDYSDGIEATCPYQQPCYVPADCATNPNTFGKADGMTGRRMLVKIQNTVPTGYNLDTPIASHASFDHSSIVCLPGAGHSQQGSFMYWLSENATQTLILYRPQDVVDYQVTQLKKLVPAGWVFAVAHPCGTYEASLGPLRNPTATSGEVGCNSQGIADYDWTAQARGKLAARMAGKTMNAASTVAYQTDGVSAITDIQIKLSNGTRLPNDPSKIAFNVLPVPR